MFWDPNVWAGQCPSDAGDAEVVLVQQNALALRDRDTQRSWI